MSVPGQFWLRLDNAAKIYPAISNRNLTSVFRSSVELKERVKARQLLESVQDLEDRFPYYKVKLKKGLFWYYLEHENLIIPVLPDFGVHCRAFGKHELMFRVLVKDRSISVEFSHILTDGYGALQFLKALLSVYFQKCGTQLPFDIDIFSPGTAPDQEEYEDAYNRYFKKINSRLIRLPAAFHLPFRLTPIPVYKIITAEIPMDVMMQKAKKDKVTITEYLVAVYLFTLQNIYEEQSVLKRRMSSNMLRMQVPVNLRKIFPSKTMRNFSLYVLPGIDTRLGHYTFEEIIKIVYHQIRLETDKKFISKIISRNVSGERNPLIRGFPLFIKSMILARLYRTSSKQYSGVVSNLGKIDFGIEMNRSIRKVITIPPPPNKALKVNCAVVGFDNKLVLSFGNVCSSNELERRFLKFLTSQNIPVKIIKPLNVKTNGNM